MTRSSYWGFLGKQWVRRGEYSSNCRGGSLNNFGWLWALGMVSGCLGPGPG